LLLCRLPWLRARLQKIRPWLSTPSHARNKQMIHFYKVICAQASQS
jgi:hypothetical protein